MLNVVSRWPHSQCGERREHRKHYLPEQDVAVSAEVQGVAVLLPVWVAATQLEVHLLPLQVTFIRHDQALSDLQEDETTV